MRKILSIVGLFGLLLSVSFAVVGCKEDSADHGLLPAEDRFVSDLAVPLEMDIYTGMELPLKGEGFEQNDAVVLQGDVEYRPEVVSLTSDRITLRMPEMESGLYSFVLTREGESQVLGRSDISVVQVINASVPDPLNTYWDADFTVEGENFKAGDRLSIVQNGTEMETVVKEITFTSLTAVMPSEAESGEALLRLYRGSVSQDLCTTTLKLGFNAEIPDKSGANIKGCVFCERKGVAGVHVSDGEVITTTDENGFYWLESTKKNGLVFVIQPAGYEVPVDKAIPQFWSKCTEAPATVEQHDFELKKVDNDAFTLLVATDMHLANRNNPLDKEQFRNGFMAEIKAGYVGSPQNVYMLNLGDFAWDLYWYSNKWDLTNCKDEIKELDFHFWSVMGNHDNDPYCANDFAAEQAYRDNLGPVYYSFNIGKVHVIMLDDTVYTNAGGAQGTVGNREYERRVTDEQIAWLKEDLKYVDKSTPIIVGMHCPVWNYRWSGTATTVGIAFRNSTDVSKLVDCFAGYSEVNIVTGHTHVNRNVIEPSTGGSDFSKARIREHNIAAVCGTWWWSYRYSQLNICCDGTPAGYKIFSVNGNDIKWQYKGMGVGLDRQFASYDMNNVLKYWNEDPDPQKFFTISGAQARKNDYADVQANDIFINVWDYEPGWTIKVTENGQELAVRQVWKYDPLHAKAYDIPRGVSEGTGTHNFQTEYTPHMFAVTASSENSTVNITVTDNFGRSFNETMTRPKAFTLAY